MCRPSLPASRRSQPRERLHSSSTLVEHTLLDEGRKGNRLAQVLRRPWLFALLFGFLAAGAAGLVSAHGGDGTQIHACVNQAATPRGQVILYSAPGLPGSDPNGACGTRGLPVDWGQ